VRIPLGSSVHLGVGQNYAVAIWHRRYGGPSEPLYCGDRCGLRPCLRPGLGSDATSLTVNVSLCGRQGAYSPLVAVVRAYTSSHRIGAVLVGVSGSFRRRELFNCPAVGGDSSHDCCLAYSVWRDLGSAASRQNRCAVPSSTQPRVTN